MAPLTAYSAFNTLALRFDASKASALEPMFDIDEMIYEKIENI
jgi:hypothetical protein